MRNAHEVVAPGQGQQACQVLNVVLVRLHVVGIAAVTAHGDPGELAHEMILQTRPGDLTGIVQILRSDKAHHGIDKEGLEPLGKAIAPGLHGHLVGAEVGIGGQLRPLARLEIHDIGALRRTLAQQQLPGLLQCGRGEAEGRVALFASGNGLENQVAGGPRPHRLHLGGDVGQDADLGGNAPVLPDLLEPAQDFSHLLRRIRHRIQADHRVSRAEAQALQCGCRDTVRVVGGVVGLQTAA